MLALVAVGSEVDELLFQGREAGAGYRQMDQLQIEGRTETGEEVGPGYAFVAVLEVRGGVAARRVTGWKQPGGTMLERRVSSMRGLPPMASVLECVYVACWASLQAGGEVEESRAEGQGLGVEQVDAGAFAGRGEEAGPGEVGGGADFVEAARLAVGRSEDPESAVGDGEHGRDGLEDLVMDEGVLVDEDEGDAGVAVGTGGHVGEGDEAGSVGENERAGVVTVGLGGQVEPMGELADAAEEFAGLGADGAEDEDERAGLGQGEVEGLGGGLSFALLGTGADGEPGGIEIEELGLAGVRLAAGHDGPAGRWNSRVGRGLRFCTFEDF